MLLFSGTTWYEEYQRLVQNVPMVLTEVLKAHSHQVLHVSFSHNGKMFATCSKDGLVIVCTLLKFIKEYYIENIFKIFRFGTQVTQPQ